MFEQAGVPPGVINMLTGEGKTVGQALVDSDIPGIISMTGSVETGSKIMETASQHMTKLSLELGGKAPCIIMADADIDRTVADIWGSRALFTGQICNSPERVYVHDSVRDEFTEKLVNKAEQTVIGLPETEGVDMCGLVNPAQLKKVSSMVERAVAAGAEVLTGGKVNEELPTGYHFQPTVLTNVKQTDEIMRKEIFGPVLPIHSFSDLDEALDLANDCEYGLTSSIFTRDAATVHRVMTELKFGETYVNRGHFEAIQGFHAGWRKSGIGGADGKHGLYEYLGTRCVYWNNY
jgi:lactaldehyde dehydrogenase/glycolaldehyde dehydrogenase